MEANISLEKKISFSIDLLRSYAGKGVIPLAYSGGKDSDVILHLAKLSGISFRPIYLCTTIDPPFTIEHCQEVGAQIVRQPKPLIKYIEAKGLPTMFRRWCCSIYKERYLGEKLIVGVRAAESVRRMKRYTEPTLCRWYGKTKYTEQILPIVFWSNEDIQQLILTEGIKVHPLYYDEFGYFHVERRLGCIGCPLQADRGVSDFVKYPKFLRLWYRALCRYRKEHPYKTSICASPADELLRHLFYSNHGENKYLQTMHGLFANDAYQILCNHFNIEL